MKYREYSFKELLSDIVDNRGRTCPAQEDGIPLIATNCIRNESLYPVYKKLRYVSQETYDTWFRGHPRPGDILFVCKGSPGRVCWVPDPIDFCIAQDMVAIRADESKIDAKYLLALLRSPEVQNQIMNMHVGTLIPHFKKGDFGNLYLSIPEDLEYQQEVGRAYFAYCEKIEANSQTNQTLEQIAQAIFKSWFVDFEPVKAKQHIRTLGGSDEQTERAAQAVIAGAVDLDVITTASDLSTLDQQLVQALSEMHAHQSDAQLEQLANTASHFPDYLVESELGLIPEGWEVGCIGDLFELHRGFDLPKTKRIDGEFPVYAAGGFHGTHNEYKIEPPGIITGRSGVIGNVYLIHEKFWPLNTTLYVREFRKCGPYYAYCFLETCDFELLNSGSAVPSLNRNFVHSLKTVVPGKGSLDWFEDLAQSISKNTTHLVKESLTLVDIRDVLLPRLLSGEMLISDIQSGSEGYIA